MRNLNTQSFAILKECYKQQDNRRRHIDRLRSLISYSFIMEVFFFVNTTKDAEITEKYYSGYVCKKIQENFILLTSTDDTHEDFR